MRNHAKVISDIINEKGYQKIAEIGVWKGDFVQGILWACPDVTEYWAIDPWHRLEGYPESRMAKMPEEEWSQLYLEVAKGMMRYPALKLLREESVTAATMFPDGYFDLVFIDGNHDYEPVLEDNKAWYPKIREGGMMTGHDYIKRIPGVRKAVNEFWGDKAQRLPATCWKVEL